MNEPALQGRDVEIEGGAKPMPGYANLPVGAARGMVVLHEIMGMQPEIKRAADRIAAKGYATIAPDLFASGLRIKCLYRALRATATGEGPMIDEILLAKDWLVRESGLDAAHVGVIGFCMGGGLALAVGKAFSAVSTNYGKVPEASVLAGTGPVIGCYGQKDWVFRNKGVELKERLSALGVEHEVHDFETVGHCFLTDGHHPIGEFLNFPLGIRHKDPAAREEGWRLIFEFFDKHL